MLLHIYVERNTFWLLFLTKFIHINSLLTIYIDSITNKSFFFQFNLLASDTFISANYHFYYQYITYILKTFLSAFFIQYINVQRYTIFTNYKKKFSIILKSFPHN